MPTGRSSGWTRDPARRSAHELAQFLMTSWQREASLVPTVDDAAAALDRDRDDMIAASALLVSEGLLEIRNMRAVGGDQLVLTRRGWREILQVWRGTTDAERQSDVREAVLDWLENRRSAPLTDFRADPRAAVYGVPMTHAEVLRAVDWLGRRGLVAFRDDTPDGVQVVESVAQRLSSGAAAARRTVRRGREASEHERAVGRKVFLVHGRDHGARDALITLLRAFDLRVISWREAAEYAGGGTPYTGDIVAAGLRLADAVVVLMTPDDVGYVRPAWRETHDGPHDLEPTGQARLNVVFEAGMAMALAKRRTVLVEMGVVRGMTDTAGLNVVRMIDTIERRRDLAARLRSAGLAVDLDGDEWRTAGNFRAGTLSPDELRPTTI